MKRERKEIEYRLIKCMRIIQNSVNDCIGIKIEKVNNQA
jgi:hypothetical protein